MFFHLSFGQRITQLDVVILILYLFFRKIIFYFLITSQMALLVQIKPLLTPGSYMKLMDTSDNFCNILDGTTTNVIARMASIFIRPLVKNIRCPVKVSNKFVLSAAIVVICN